jgi:hypothetical protein
MVPLGGRPSCFGRQLNRLYAWAFNSDSGMAAMNDKNGRDDPVGVSCAMRGRTNECGNKREDGACRSFLEVETGGSFANVDVPVGGGVE